MHIEVIDNSLLITGEWPVPKSWIEAACAFGGPWVFGEYITVVEHATTTAVFLPINRREPKRMTWWTYEFGNN
jgi:hypothetical protein